MMIRRFSAGFSLPTPKALDTIVKKELLENETAGNIQEIWHNFHKTKTDCVGLSMAKDAHQTLVQRGRQSPFFVFPVKREKGLFTMISQFQEKYILMTYLEAFKKNASQAPPYLTISLYDDLLESKNISLLRADIVNELNKPEATQLVETLLSYYIQDTQYEMVDKFNHRPTDFDFEAYLAQY